MTTEDKLKIIHSYATALFWSDDENGISVSVFPRGKRISGFGSNRYEAINSLYRSLENSMKDELLDVGDEVINGY